MSIKLSQSVYETTAQCSNISEWKQGIRVLGPFRIDVRDCTCTQVRVSLFKEVGHDQVDNWKGIINPIPNQPKTEELGDDVPKQTQIACCVHNEELEKPSLEANVASDQ